MATHNCVIRKVSSLLIVFSLFFLGYASAETPSVGLLSQDGLSVFTDSHSVVLRGFVAADQIVDHVSVVLPGGTVIATQLLPSGSTNLTFWYTAPTALALGDNALTLIAYSRTAEIVRQSTSINVGDTLYQKIFNGQAAGVDVIPPLSSPALHLTFDNVGPFQYSQAANAVALDFSTTLSTGIISRPKPQAAVFGRGKFGDALTFDGSGGYVYIPSFQGIPTDGTGGAITISTWINIPKEGGGTLLSFDSIGQDTTGALNFYIRNGDGTTTTTSNKKYLFIEVNNIQVLKTNLPISRIGGWMHLGFTFSPTTHRAAVYFNGQPQTLSNASMKTPSFLPNEPMLIGRRGVQSNSFLKGSIDDLRIFPRVLARGEIAILRQAKELQLSVISPELTSLSTCATVSTTVNNWSSLFIIPGAQGASRTNLTTPLCLPSGTILEAYGAYIHPSFNSLPAAAVIWIKRPNVIVRGGIFEGDTSDIESGSIPFSPNARARMGIVLGADANGLVAKNIVIEDTDLRQFTATWQFKGTVNGHSPTGCPAQPATYPESYCAPHARHEAYWTTPVIKDACRCIPENLGDGIYIGVAGGNQNAVPEKLVINRSKFSYNERNGITITRAKGTILENISASNQFYLAGFDHEPDPSPSLDIPLTQGSLLVLQNTSFSKNYSGALIQDHYGDIDAELVTVKNNTYLGFSINGLYGWKVLQDPNYKPFNCAIKDITATGNYRGLIFGSFTPCIMNIENIGADRNTGSGLLIAGHPQFSITGGLITNNTVGAAISTILQSTVQQRTHSTTDLSTIAQVSIDGNISNDITFQWNIPSNNAASPGGAFTCTTAECIPTQHIELNGVTFGASKVKWLSTIKGALACNPYPDKLRVKLSQPGCP